VRPPCALDSRRSPSSRPSGLRALAPIQRRRLRHRPPVPESARPRGAGERGSTQPQGWPDRPRRVNAGGPASVLSVTAKPVRMVAMHRANQLAHAPARGARRSSQPCTCR
jgi:hypothetical protein